PGTYQVRMGGGLHARSPWFVVGTRASLFDPLIADVVRFFQAQRDGADVIPGPLHRKPSHLNDANAELYAWPTYDAPGDDVIVGSHLKPLNARVDLEGGWFDAGDFLKFTHTTSYALVMLLVSERTLGDQAPQTLDPEIRFGLAWLRKTWHPSTG